jgi:hypothetical protein
MKARGKRKARRPWFYAARAIRPERPKYVQYSAPSGLGLGLIVAYQGRRALRLPLAFIYRAFGAAYPGAR